MSTEMITSSDPCPTCLLQNKVINPLRNRPGQFFTYCAAGHKFEDTEELNILRTQARAKYPAIYKAAEPPKPDPASFVSADIVISATAKKEIEELCGIQFTGSADLKGTIFAFVQDVKDKDGEIRSLRAQMEAFKRGQAAGAHSGKAPKIAANQIVVEIPEWALETAASYAEHEGTTVQAWVAKEFNGWVESYFGVPPGRTVGVR